MPAKTRNVGKLEFVQRVIPESGLHRTARTVACAYAAFADSDGSSIFPGAKAVADATGYSLRTVETWTRVLEATDYLTLVEKGRGRGPGKGGKNSVYRLSQPAILADRLDGQPGVNRQSVQSQPAILAGPVLGPRPDHSPNGVAVADAPAAAGQDSGGFAGNPDEETGGDRAVPAGNSGVESVVEDTSRVVVDSFEDLNEKVPGRKRRAKPEDPNLAEAKIITDSFWKRYAATGQLGAQSYMGIRGVIKTAVANGCSRKEIANALKIVMDGGWPVTGNTLTKGIATYRGTSAPARRPATRPEAEYETGFDGRKVARG